MIELRTCLYCQSGLHEECGQPESLQEVRDVIASGTAITAPEWLKCCCGNQAPVDDEPAERNGVGRPLLPVEQITDITSTGRKRAAKLYPIWPGMVCEWAGLRNAGGGINPIIGCNGNIIADVKRNADLPPGVDSRGDRHHGPDKNVLNNEPGNVHRICSPCHNRWHYKNNDTYPGTRPPAGEHWYPEGEWAPHDPITKASDDELSENERYWTSYKLDRVDTLD